MLRLLTISAFIIVCSAAAGCADDDPITGPIETPTEITETFTGTVTILGASTHVFTTERQGQASVQLESLAPDSAAMVSLIFGTWNGAACELRIVNDNATTGTALIGNASAGSFCVRVSDIGRLTEPTTYSIKVLHF
jgi:hypothetical protein